MRNRLPWALLGVVLLAGVCPGAEPAAPLESSRQELRKLEGGQKPGAGPSATEGIRPSLPTIQAPGQDSLQSLQFADPEKIEKERKRQKEERKNWLVNGVEQLERKDKEKQVGAFVPEDSETGGSRARSADAADPQYLLKLYDEQKKIEDAHKTEVKPQRTPSSDPLAPFLQGWLGNSPVRGQFFDEFVRKPDGAAATPGPADPISGGPRRDFEPIAERAPSPVNVPPRTNPYLVEMNKPVPGSPAGGVLSVETTVSPVVAPPVFSTPALPAGEPPAQVQPPEKKPFAPPLADDKKYFPQLKRF